MAEADRSWLVPLPPATRFILQGGAAARAAAAVLWGVDLSEQPCRAIVHEARATLWLGPDEHLLLDRARHDGDGVGRALEQTLSALPHSLVDVSDRQVGFELRGPRAARILAGGCPLDLHLSSFPVGMCTRTVFAKAEIVLWRTADEAFHVEVWRSFADYALGLMQEIDSLLD